MRCARTPSHLIIEKSEHYLPLFAMGEFDTCVVCSQYALDGECVHESKAISNGQQILCDS